MCFSHTIENGGNAPFILLIEDDASVGNLLTEVLSVEVCGGKQPFYRVEQAESEKVALSLLGSMPPLLCIFEHHPPMMDGLRLYDQMCAIYKTEQIPALLISNDLPQMELIRRQLSGLQKPFDLEHFIRLVRDMLAVSHEYESSQGKKQGSSHALDFSLWPHISAFSRRETAACLSRTTTRVWLFLSSSEGGITYPDTVLD